jgi:hypothetical protein
VSLNCGHHRTVLNHMPLGKSGVGSAIPELAGELQPFAANVRFRAFVM